VTEPISDEDLEWFRRSLASDRHGIRIEMGTEQLRGVLTRLDAAEAQMAEWKCNASAAPDRYRETTAGLDAALARAVPDGHTRINGRVWRLEATDDINRYRLVPADTEP